MRRGASVTVLRRSAMSWLMGGVPSATTAPRAGLRASAVMLVLLGLVAAGCTREPAAPPSHRLEGTYIVHGVFSHQRFGGPCRSEWLAGDAEASIVPMPPGARRIAGR